MLRDCLASASQQLSAKNNLVSQFSERISKLRPCQYQFCYGSTSSIATDKLISAFRKGRDSEMPIYSTQIVRLDGLMLAASIENSPVRPSKAVLWKKYS
jgi:hypothetical protein